MYTYMFVQPNRVMASELDKADTAFSIELGTCACSLAQNSFVLICWGVEPMRSALES